MILSPLFISESITLSPNRASPFDCSAIISTTSSVNFASMARRALLKILTSESLSNRSNTNTFKRDSKAEFNSKLGFSVVAPIRIIVPRSTYGNSLSCCDLFHLCISSMNKIVFLPRRSPDSARSTMDRKSLTPP